MKTFRFNTKYMDNELVRINLCAFTNDRVCPVLLDAITGETVAKLGVSFPEIAPVGEGCFFMKILDEGLGIGEELIRCNIAKPTGMYKAGQPQYAEFQLQPEEDWIADAAVTETQEESVTYDQCITAIDELVVELESIAEDFARKEDDDGTFDDVQDIIDNLACQSGTVQTIIDKLRKLQG